MISRTLAYMEADHLTQRIQDLNQFGSVLPALLCHSIAFVKQMNRFNSLLKRFFADVEVVQRQRLAQSSLAMPDQ